MTRVARIPMHSERPMVAFEGTMRLLDQAKQFGDRIVNLGIGTSQYTRSVESQKFAVDLHDLSTYGPPTGDPALREQLCGFLKWMYPRCDVAPERLVITDGGSNALYLALLSIVRRGGEVLMPEVHYPSFRPLVDVVGGHSRLWGLDSRGETDWSTLRAAVSERSAAVIVNSPSNPLGACATRADYAAFAELGIPIISDEVYGGLGPESGTVLELPGNHYMIGSFSKLFAVPGLRLGFLVVPEGGFEHVKNLRMALNIATAISSQKLGLSLLERADDIIPKHREYLRVRRERALGLCRTLGLPLVNDGRGEGFYVCVDVRALGVSSMNFASLLLRGAQVTVCPGSDFVASGDPTFVRVNVAVDAGALETGLRRIAVLYHELMADRAVAVAGS